VDGEGGGAEVEGTPEVQDGEVPDGTLQPEVDVVIPPDGCSPDCIGKQCGDDGCGGTCGECGDKETCEAGECLFDLCPAKPCPEGSVCNETTGECVGCLSDDDCLPNNHCVDGNCQAPTPCQSSKDCADDEVCDKELLICVECVEDADCPEGFRCNADNVCEEILVCSSDKECKDYDKVCDKTLGECVDCIVDADCDVDEYCVASKCAPDACDQTATWPACLDGDVASCNENGSVLTVIADCLETEYCLDAACHALVCQPGEKGCKENAKYVCNELGSDYASITECGPGFACANGDCFEIGCQPGGTACLDDKTLVTCGAEEGVFTVIPCGPEHYCHPDLGQCSFWVCAPGKKGCDGTVSYLCNDIGSKKDVLLDCAVQGLACSAGECVECDPMCGDHNCGPDACGGTCGECQGGQACLAGYCLAVGCAGACTGKTEAAMACALDLCYPTLISSVTVSSVTGDMISESWEAMAGFGTPGNNLVPFAGGSFAALSTGTIQGTPQSDDLQGGATATDPFIPGSDIHDVIDLKIVGTAPAGVTGFSFNYIFMSVEFEEWIGSDFNDKFYMILKAPTTTGNVPIVINAGDCLNPGAFYDFVDSKGAKKCFIGINSAFGEPCTAPVTNIAGTGFECSAQANDHGGSSTGWLTTQWPILPGEPFELVLHVHDTGDGIYDSMVLVDNFAWLSGAFAAGTYKAQ